MKRALQQWLTGQDSKTDIREGRVNGNKQMGTNGNESTKIKWQQIYKENKWTNEQGRETGQTQMKMKRKTERNTKGKGTGVAGTN